MEQHSRSDDHSEKLATQESRLETGTDGPVDDDNDNVATNQHFNGSQASLQTPATLPSSSEPREYSHLQARSAGSENEPGLTGGVIETAVKLILEQAAATRRENAKRSTMSHMPKPAGSTADTPTKQYGSEELEGLTKQMDDAISEAAAAISVRIKLSSEIRKVERNAARWSKGHGKGEVTTKLPDTQAIRPHSTEPYERPGVQGTSADADLQLVQGEGDRELGESFTNMLEQILPCRREDGEDGSGGSSAEGVAHISDAALSQHLVGEAPETYVKPTANAPTILQRAEMDDASDSDGAESVLSPSSLESTATSHQLYRLRVSKAVGGKTIGELGKELDPEALKVAVEEISWVPIHLFTFEEPWSFRLPVLDRLKGFIEDKMDEQWNWSPMSPRLHPLRLDCYRLQWKSPCGIPHHIDLPLETLEPLKAALSKAPAFLGPVPAPSAGFMEELDARCRFTDPLRSSRFSLLMDQVLNVWGSPRIMVSSIALNSNIQRAHSTLSPAPTAADTSLVSTTTSANVQASLEASHTSHRPGTPDVQASLTSDHEHSSYLYLCIRLRNPHFVEIECDAMKNDLELFHALKAAYNQSRGPLRRWFSVWQYDHCKFFVFRKWGVHLGGPLYADFPLTADLLYDFKPRPPVPPPPHGPIAAGEFRDHYYYSNRRPMWAHLSRSTTSYVRFRGLNTDALEALPKRVRRLELEDEKRELFHGLLAVEARCGLRMAVYCFLLNAPWIVFLFLWLLPLGHPLDLQGATVPLMVSLAAMTVFLAMVALV